MGTELLKTTSGVDLKRFFGGANRGVCVQITCALPSDPNKVESADGTYVVGSIGYVQLTVNDVMELLPALQKFVKEHT